MIKSSLFVFLLSLAALADEHNVIGCRIYDMNKKLIRAYPGQICSFLEDGTFFSAQHDSIGFFSKDLKPIWSQRLPIHHQVNRLLDDSAFLVMGSEVFDKVRYDQLIILDKKGSKKKIFSFFSNKKVIEGEIKKHKLQAKEGSIDWIKDMFPEAKSEFSHANSFYQIDENKSAHKVAAFRKGNFIVNSSVLKLIFILDKDLKNILWSLSTPDVSCDVSHDAQVLENGNILYLCNRHGQFGVTRLIEYSPLKRKEVWVYPPALEKSHIQFENSGGVQLLKNGNILFNDLTKDPRAIEINHEGKEVWRLDYPFYDGKSGNPTPFQQIKRINLTEFLKNNSSI